METQQIDLKNESNRLSTFGGWPVSFIITPKDLAAAGFYYTKQTDKVKCAFCNICICRWEYGDNAVDEHKRHNPNCSFILNQNCGNIPVIEGIQLRGEFIENHKETGEPIDIRGLGVRAHRVAVHLTYNSYSARLKTFRGWRNESQNPEDLACAGFFFTGSNDEVRCYYCDGGLQRWELTDNPWVEHAKWFPNCGFLNLVKGEKFLDGNLVERFNSLLNRPSSSGEPQSSSSLTQEVVSIHETDDVTFEYSTDDIAVDSPDTTTSNGHNEITDQQISHYMSLPPALMALQLGLQPSEVQQAIRDNLQDTGRPFRSVDSFLQQVLGLNQTDGEILTLEEIIRRDGVNCPIQLTRIYHPDDPDYDDVGNDELDELELYSEVEDSDDESGTQNQNINPPLGDELIQRVTNNDNFDYSVERRVIEEKPKESSVESEKIQSSEEEKSKEESSESEKTLSIQADIMEENRRLKEARLCKICLDQELGVVMLPCAHLVACIACASNLPDCPLCRQTIKATVRTFLS